MRRVQEVTVHSEVIGLEFKGRKQTQLLLEATLLNLLDSLALAVLRGPWLLAKEHMYFFCDGHIRDGHSLESYINFDISYQASSPEFLVQCRRNLLKSLVSTGHRC